MSQVGRHTAGGLAARRLVPTRSHYDRPGPAARPGVYFPYRCAQRSTDWERGTDPKTAASFVDDYDVYGQPRASSEIAVHRGRDYRQHEPELGRAYLATLTLTDYALRDDGDRYIVDRVSRATSFEIANDGTPSLLELHDLILGEGQRFMRAVKKGVDGYLAATGDPRAVPVVNLQCDVDHPTQTLADLLWLRECFSGGLRGLRVAVSWAYSPSYAKPLSVPQGLIALLTRFGAHVTLAHPEGYRLLPETLRAAHAGALASDGSLRVTDSMDEAFAGAEVVYPKSWGPFELMQERVEANRSGDRSRLLEIERRALEQNARHRDWICDERRMAMTRDALYLHCLPADIGSEVSPEVMDRFRVSVARQANKKLYVIMAVLAASKVEDLPARLEALEG